MNRKEEMRATGIALEVRTEIALEQAVTELGFRLETEIGAAALQILAKYVGRVIARRERHASLVG